MATLRATLFRKDAKRKSKIPSNGARRAGAVHSPRRVEDFLASALVKLARRWNAQARAILLPTLKAFSKPPKDERRDAKRPSTKALEQKLRSAASRTLSQQAVRSVTEQAARRVESYSKDAYRRIGISPKKDPDLKWLVNGWSKDIAARAKGLTDLQVDQLAKLLDGAGNREASFVAKDIEAQLGVTESRAEFLARDGIITLNGKIGRARMEAAKVRYYIWTSQNDDRVRPKHDELNGETFEVDGDGDPDEGHPGDPPNCFPGSTRIACSNSVERAFRYWYSGELTTLVTNTGVTLDCTPNHPILTAAGWKPAKDLNVGDHVFEASAKHRLFAKGHNEDRYPEIAEAFYACTLLGNAARIVGSAVQFHGDGRVDEKVDVVELDGGLLHDVEPALAERACESVFTDTLVRPQLEPVVRSLTFGLVGVGLSPSFRVRRLGQRLALLAARLGHTQVHRFASIPRVDPITLEEVRDRLALLRPESLRESLDRHTLPIELETFLLREACAAIRRGERRVDTAIAKGSPNFLCNVLGAEMIGGRASPDLRDRHPAFKCRAPLVQKLTRHFEGHVFDLQTRLGWYQTSLVNSNCRCTAFPLPADEQEADEDE